MLFKLPFSTLLLMIAFGCSDSSDFASGGSSKRDKAPAALEETAETEETAAAPPPEVGDIYSSNVVEKGVFKVWSEPAKPYRREKYRIFIEVNTGEKPKIDSLGGKVNGSDGFLEVFNSIEYKNIYKYPDKQNVFFVEIPGGELKVKDTVEVNYDGQGLNENETMELIFGS